MRRYTTLIFILLAVLASSCGRIDLNGEWKIISVGVDTVQSSQAVPTLSFNEETGLVHGYTGVNVFNGEYTQEGRRLSLDNIGMTRMAGPADDMELERKIITAFEAVHSTRMTENDDLIFINNEGDTLMTLARKTR